MNNNILWTATLGIFASLNLYWNIFGNYNIHYLNIYNGGTEFIPIQNNDFSNLCNEIQKDKGEKIRERREANKAER